MFSLKPQRQSGAAYALAFVSLIIGPSALGAAALKFAPPPDGSPIEAAMKGLAMTAMAEWHNDGSDWFLNNLFRLQMTAGQYSEALATVEEAERRALSAHRSVGILVPDIIFARARLEEQRGLPANEAINGAAAAVLGKLDDKGAADADGWLWAPVERLKQKFDETMDRQRVRGAIELPEALDLIREYQLCQEYQNLAPASDALIAADDARRYVIERDVPVSAGGGISLDVQLFRPRAAERRQPAALNFTIYASPFAVTMARLAAAHGYAGVVAFARGKGISGNQILPWEVELGDVNAVIGWIARQPWSDGQVGMFGGSYEGFVQWAALKRPNPALKTVVPWSAVHPGLVLPMSNNVFQNANYQWGFYVTDNRTLDWAVNSDQHRWDTLLQRWYASGKPYREIDQVDGTPNPLLQRQLQHPAFDAYWQAMAPFKTEFANIHIPILQISGYFDPAEIAALYYLTEHYRYCPGAEDYLVVGPYDHQGAQASQKPPNVGGYLVDEAAQFDTPELTFAWFDYVMRGRPKPAMIADRINCEVMGADTWRHAPTLEAMHDGVMRLYLGSGTAGSPHALGTSKPEKPGFVRQVVDFGNRSLNNNIYPVGVLTKAPSNENGIVYESEPFEEPLTIAGRITGSLDAVVNKRDMDVSMAFYEALPEGGYLDLGYYLGRASFARDPGKRRLLEPGRAEAIPFTQTPFIARQMRKGSRLLVLLSVNKNQYAQVNYGTGGDVSDESLEAGASPLQVDWLNDSYVDVPIAR
jgi:putative CocE/NonD family hydrolase